MPLVTMKEVLSESVAKKYAVGAFDTFDPLFTEAILTGAERKGTPVILMVVEWSFDEVNCEHFFAYLVNRCRMSSVPVALHLDHGSSFEAVMKAIHYGCTSVMLDGSSLPMEENIALTKKVVEVAHACGVTVEAEIGHVAGHEGNMLDGNVADESAYTTVHDAVYFCQQTDVDALAIAIGTVHGVYKGEPKLDLVRLDQIRSHLEIPLVLHGGSGLSPEMFRSAVRHGINKINFFTGMTLAATAAVREILDASTGNIPFHSRFMKN
ncbi:MAG: class II fructose-bisphosphate aldolase [Christensenellales bacterium]|jgi:fructose-bisphosphate aldolase class II